MVQIIQDKLKHKYIYTLEVGILELKRIIKFTLLTWREYKAFSDLINSGIPIISIEEIIWEKCILDTNYRTSSVWEKLPAGLISTVAKLILYLSGSNTLEDINMKLNEQRKHVAVDVTHQIPMYICAAFPSYKPEDFDDMPWPDVLIRLAQAEKILLDRQILDEPIQWKPLEKNNDKPNFESDNQGLSEI